MLFGVECNHKFYTIINCLLLHARSLILRCKTTKNIPNLKSTFLLFNMQKQLKNESLKNIID